MKILKKKSQGAMEYLMSYGWVVLVILALGTALWYLGMFQPQKSPTPTASKYTKIKPLEPSIVMTPDCVFSAIFVNGEGSSIEVTDISIYNIGDEWTCSNKISGAGNYSSGGQIYVKQSACCSQTHASGDSYALRVRINYSKVVAGSPITNVDVGNIFGYYVEGVQLKTCNEQGGTCCGPSFNACNPPGSQLPASDCGVCCAAGGSCTQVTTTTTTTSTTTSSTTTTSTTTTLSATTSTTSTIGSTISGVVICGTYYNCGVSDTVCPEDFSPNSCDTTDPNC